MSFPQFSQLLNHSATQQYESASGNKKNRWFLDWFRWRNSKEAPSDTLYLFIWPCRVSSAEKAFCLPEKEHNKELIQYSQWGQLFKSAKKWILYKSHHIILYHSLRWTSKTAARSKAATWSSSYLLEPEHGGEGGEQMRMEADETPSCTEKQQFTYNEEKFESIKITENYL